MARLDIRHLVKSFATTPVLRGIDLSVADGELIAILGPSGCGKSTLLRIVAGLEAHDAGEVLIDGRSVDALPPKARDVAVVFQSYALYPHMTVAQNLALPLVMRDLSRAQRLPFARRLSGRVRTIRATIRAAVVEAADLLEIGSLLDRKPAQLSGGQRQRVALARALVRQPRLFLLDEPLSNLDAALRATTRAEIVQLQRRLGTTTLYVTHDQTEAMTMADRIAVMIGGQVVQVGTAHEIYDAPEDVRAALFVGTPKMNLFPASAADGRVRLDGSPVVVGLCHARAGALRVGVRPEHLTIAPEPSAGLAAEVRHVEFLGSEALAHVSIAGLGAGAGPPAVARLSPDVVGTLRIGARVGVGIQAGRLHVFDADGRRVALAPVADAPSARHAGATG